MPLMPLNQQLTDLGGVPVLWDSDLGTLVQDPTQGGTNRYGPGDLFRDPSSGDVYQLGSDGSLSLYRIGAPPSVPVPASTTVSVSSAGKSWTSSPTTSGPVTVAGDPQTWSKQLISWLSAQSSIGHMPNWSLVALAAAAYTLVKRRRRNPRPILRNPSGGARVVYNRLLGGWYVVVGRHQTPISGRFDSKAEAEAWLRGRRRNPGKAKRAARRRAHEYVSELVRLERGVRQSMGPATAALRRRRGRRFSERVVMRSYGY